MIGSCSVVSIVEQLERLRSVDSQRERFSYSFEVCRFTASGGAQLGSWHKTASQLGLVGPVILRNWDWMVLYLYQQKMNAGDYCKASMVQMMLRDWLRSRGSKERGRRRGRIP